MDRLRPDLKIIRGTTWRSLVHRQRPRCLKYFRWHLEISLFNLLDGIRDHGQVAAALC